MKKIKFFFKWVAIMCVLLFIIWFALGFIALLIDDSVVSVKSAFCDNGKFYKSLLDGKE